MAKIPQTKSDYRKIIEAAENFYPDVFLGAGYARATSWQIPELNLSWTKASDFLRYVFDLTKTNDIKKAYDSLVKSVSEAPEEAVAPEKLDQTTPTKEALESGEAERARRQEVKESAEKRAKEDVASAIKKKQEIAEAQKAISEQLEKTKAAQKDLKGKTIYTKVEEPPEPKLTADETKAYAELKDLAQKNPRQLQEELSGAIQSKIPESVKSASSPEELKLFADNVSVETVKKLRLPATEKPDMEGAILATLSTNKSALQKSILNIETRANTEQAVNDLARLKLLLSQTHSGALDTVLGPNIRKLILGPSPSEISITILETPQGATHELNLSQLNLNYQSSLQSPLFSLAQDEARGQILDFGKQQLISKLEALPSKSVLGRVVATERFQGALSFLQPSTAFEFVGAEGLAGKFGGFVFRFAPESAPLLSGFGKIVGLDFGVARIVSALTPAAAEAVAVAGAGEATKAISGKAVGAAVTSKLAGTAIGTALGSALPVVGNIIGAAVGWFGGKVVGKTLSWLKENPWALFLPILPIGVALGLPALSLAGLAGMGIVRAGGLRAAASAAFNFTRFVTLSLLLPSVLWPTMVFLVVFPLVIALTLVVINSGAYLVPPSDFSAVSDNPYVSVEKTASPEGPFQNTDLPISVTYQITVSAKKGSLTNVSFNHICRVIGEGSTTNCPAPLPEETPQTISAADPFVYSYSQTFSGNQYQDSLILNTFTVTADTADSTPTTTSGAASLVVGNPPTGCFELVGSWPSSARSNVQAGISYLVSNHTSFVAKVCSGGNIQVVYDPTPVSHWGYAEYSKITLYSGGVGNTTNAAYIMAHEAGHLLSWRIPSLYQQYRDTTGLSSERPLCSYLATSDPFEAFAEAAALYGSPKTFSCMGSSFSGTYPNHYTFAKDVLFR